MKKIAYLVSIIFINIHADNTQMTNKLEQIQNKINQYSKIIEERPKILAEKISRVEELKEKKKEIDKKIGLYLSVMDSCANSSVSQVVCSDFMKLEIGEELKEWKDRIDDMLYEVSMELSHEENKQKDMEFLKNVLKSSY